MEFIELKSVGSLVTNLGDVHPTSDVDNKIAGEGVNIFDVDDEWIWSLSLVDGYNLLSFLEDSGLVLPDGFTDKVEGLIGSYDTFVGVA